MRSLVLGLLLFIALALAADAALGFLASTRGLEAAQVGRTAHRWTSLSILVVFPAVLASRYVRAWRLQRRLEREVRAGTVPWWLSGSVEKIGRRADPFGTAALFLLAISVGMGFGTSRGGWSAPWHAGIGAAAVAVALGTLGIEAATWIALDRVQAGRNVLWTRARRPEPGSLSADPAGSIREGGS